MKISRTFSTNLSCIPTTQVYSVQFLGTTEQLFLLEDCLEHLFQEFKQEHPEAFEIRGRLRKAFLKYFVVKPFSKSPYRQVFNLSKTVFYRGTMAPDEAGLEVVQSFRKHFQANEGGQGLYLTPQSELAEKYGTQVAKAEVCLSPDEVGYVKNNSTTLAWMTPKEIFLFLQKKGVAAEYWGQVNAYFMNRILPARYQSLGYQGVFFKETLTYGKDTPQLVVFHSDKVRFF